MVHPHYNYKENQMAKKKTITDAEFDILFGNTGGEIKIGEKIFPIYPFNVEQTQAVLEKIGILIPVFYENYNDKTGELELDYVQIIGLGVEVYNGLVEVVSLCMNLDERYVKRLDFGTFIAAIAEIIRINKSFFDERVKSIVSEMKENLRPEDSKKLTAKTDSTED